MAELAGWIEVGGRLEPLMTVAGCLARGESIEGHCKTRECFRRVTLDLNELARVGFGKSDIKALQSGWRCGAGQGCKMTWGSGLYPEGVPLQHYVGSGCTVVITCGSCGRTRRYDVQQLVETLRRRGAGDGNTSVRKVAETVRGACPTCGKKAWVADLVWPVAHGQGKFHADPMPKRA